jgi:hypothetical protein
MILVAASALAKLAAAQTIMVGRTLTRHAVPITFGPKAAGWLNGVLDALYGIVLARNGLRVQCGGAAGTPAAIAELADDHGIDWSAGLAVPRSPKSASWQARGLWRILHDAAEARPSAGGPDPPSRGNGTGARFWPRSRIRRRDTVDHRRHAAPVRENGNAAMTFDLTATQLCNRR